MKLIRNILLIPVLIVAVAGLTYLTLNYVTESDSNEEISEVELNEEQNFELKDLIEQEQDRIEQKLDSSIDLDSEEEIELEFNEIDQQDWQLNLNQQSELKLDTEGILTDEVEDQEEMKDEQPTDDQFNEQLEEQDTEEKLEEEVEDKFFLGMKDGQVAVYKGDALEEKELVEVMEEIPLEHLSEEDIESLQVGLEVESEEELLRILEGFASARD
ncbi:BofC C-terminal domain-containing protein [Natroniella sulfidigena]|uniref:BofC C-terminal domain-containing protein n=1 Tax=Natroniella sulfidigena TaxID=723921 RepID=UPI00200B09BD|nr:BofC C-terminal domain-containing protein [Natroniella sulfidigena]MCK8815961.1 BofC C-terminal domain-containing protein [Natroniella sulfidigena]